jgi:hypothetical protein
VRQERRRVAAVLDVLWSVAAYERIVGEWHLDSAEAIAGLTWAIDLVVAAITPDAPREQAK